MYIIVYFCIQVFNSDVSYYQDHSNVPSYPINGKPNALSDRDRNTLTCNDIAGVTLKNVTLKNEFGDHKKHPKRNVHVHVSICLLVYYIYLAPSGNCTVYM